MSRCAATVEHREVLTSNRQDPGSSVTLASIPSPKGNKALLFQSFAIPAWGVLWCLDIMTELVQ